MITKRKFSKTELALFFLIGLIPFSFALNPTLTIDLALIRILIPIFFLSWLFSSLFKKRLIIDSRFRAWLLIFIFLLAICSLFWAPNSSKAWRKILFLGSIFPFYWIIFPFLKKKTNLNLVLKIIFGTAFVSALIGLFQFFSQFIFGIDTVFQVQAHLTPLFLGKNFSKVVLEYNSWLVNINGKTVFRALGLFPDPHLFSLFLNLSIPIGFYLFSKNKQFFSLIGTLIILLSSLLTFSRAGYLSLILAFAFFWLFHLNKKSFWNILLILIFSLFLLIPNPINQRFFSIFNFQDGSVSERLILWKTGLKVTQNNFWTGVGIGNLSEELRPLSNQRIPIYAHNLFLDFSTELGFFGGLAIFLIIISPIMAFFRQSTPQKNLIATIFIIILTNSMFETPFYSVQILPLILILLAI